MLLCLALYACNNSTSTPELKSSSSSIQQSSQSIKVDGILDSEWNTVPWQNMDQRWLGPEYTKEDFQGRYKLLWDKQFLYVFAEIQDDKLIDIYEDGLNRYWDDDCLEIFIDEDASKGKHQFSHNAFAYHIALDGRGVDFSTDSLPHYYNDHIKSKRLTKGNTSNWEAAISIFDDSYNDNKSNTPVSLSKGKKMGFAIAYCDNDDSESRENFIGSVFVEGEDKNQGYIDAGIFKTVTLK